MNLTPAERRAAEGLAVESTAPASTRALQRDFAGTAALSFVFSSAQYAQWLAWWKNDLVYGGAWFSAPTWPFPWGLGAVLRHASAPTVRHLGRGIRQVDVQADVRGASLPPQLRTSFDGLLAMLARNLVPMAETPQTPRWEPDTPSGTEWFVRPLQEMATSEATGDRFTALDTAASDYDAGDSGTWTTFFNHPLSGDRDTNPIDPASVVAVGYPNKTWTGAPTAMSTEVLLDTTTSPGTTLYYIRSSRGPGFVDPLDSLFKGTATVSWNYADLSVLDGTTYAKAWPGFDAIDWSAIDPGDTLWVCGTFENETLQVGASGTAGAYIRIRFDRSGTPGRINQAAVITGPWTASGDAWWAPVQDVTECMLYEDEERLIGINTRSRCRVPVTAVDDAADTITFGNIRRVQTGHLVYFGSDQVWEESLPAGLLPNTPYYCIVISSNWAYYSVSQAQYTVKLAASYADAIAGTAIDIGPKPVPSRNLLIFVQQHDYPFYDPVFTALEAGQYAVDVENQRLYYRPTTGTPDDHELRIASESYAAIGACIYGVGVSYIKVLGGGEYGGLFADTPAPAGRVGMAHQDAIQFDTGSDIVVDGMQIQGCRSGVNFIDIEDGTVRNNRITDCAHHACGGEDLTGTQEPGLLIERNWIDKIGHKHEFGDAQAAVTNPACDNSIFRRNRIQTVGRNTKVSNPAVFVFDGSANISAYLNWADDCYGKTFELDAGVTGGVPDPVLIDGVIAANIVTRQGQGNTVDRAENLVQRTGLVHLNLNGLTDPGIDNAQIFGNLFAYTTIGVRAPDTLDDCGAIYQRTNNHTTGGGSNDISVCRQNAFLEVTGPVFSAQKNTNAAAAPWPTLVSDYNLYANCADFAITASSGTILDTWSIDEVFGGAGTWQGDTGNDAHSVVTRLLPGERPDEPTLEDLEIIRLYDAYDTYDQPTLAMVGNFPFDEAVA
jgi:hypothetical protein